MKERGEGHDPADTLAITHFASSSLIGSDTLDEGIMARIEQEIKDGKKLDPTIIYDIKGAHFIIEGNQRAGAYGNLGREVPCVVVQNDEDFQRIKKSGIKVGKLVDFASLQEVHDALADHMWNERKDVYWKYFDEEK